MFTINEFGRQKESVELSENGKIKTRFTGEKVFKVDYECYESLLKFRFDLMNNGKFMILPSCVTATNRDENLSVLIIWYGKNDHGMWIDLSIDGKVYPLINVFGTFSGDDEKEDD